MFFQGREGHLDTYNDNLIKSIRLSSISINYAFKQANILLYMGTVPADTVAGLNVVFEVPGIFASNRFTCIPITQ